MFAKIVARLPWRRPGLRLQQTPDNGVRVVLVPRPVEFDHDVHRHPFSFAGASLRQFLPLPRGALAFAASLIWLPKVLSGLGVPVSCFGFLISRLLRFWPLAMSKRPFDERGAAAGLRHADRLEAVFSRYAFMTLVVVADPVLQ